MTVIYERDLEVRFLQGTTTLRVSTSPDPYAQSGTGSADSAKLTEFKNYWVANYGGVSRAAAMMLSGKQLKPQLRVGDRVRQHSLQHDRRVHIFPGVQVLREHGIERRAPRGP